MFESGAKVLPSKAMPTLDDALGLGKRAKELGSDMSQATQNAGSLGYYMPAHNIAMEKTIGNAVNYINAQRPSPVKALPLDQDPKPTKMEEANFNRTLTVAQQPLMALHYIKEGTLLPQDVATVKNVFPDYYNKMSQQILSQMAKSQQNGDSIPYRIKQGMSMFLGQPLDSTMTPASIQAAQSVYATQAATQQQQTQGQPRAKKSTAKLGNIAKDHYTSDQARSMRQSEG